MKINFLLFMTRAMRK